MLVRVLLAVSRPHLRTRLLRLLSQRSVIPATLPADSDLLAHLQSRTSDLVVLDAAKLPADARERTHLVEAVHALPERPELVLITRREPPSLRAALQSIGLVTVLDERVSDEALEEALRALIRRRREAVQQSLGTDRFAGQARLADFVSDSPVMAEFLDVVRRVVPADSSLLILGETGVGKERLARAIHAEGPRARAPFLAVNCAALPEALLESELFGHEEGAFTGATRLHRGYFELAHRGTIFLDEIGEMPAHVQVKLLRVLQERQIRPVGSEAPVGIDVRVMAATNRDLAADLRSGRFRADLYYRLGVVTLTVPPLRERRADIEALVGSYIEHFRTRGSNRVRQVEPTAMAALMQYAWPGNVRELINVVERAVLLGRGESIALSDLPADIRNGGVPERVNNGACDSPGSPASRPWREARQAAAAEFERAYFTALLQQTGGRVAETARRAGIDPRSLFDKLRRFGVKKEDFRRHEKAAEESN